SETHLCSFRNIVPLERASLFRVREIFRYHSRGSPQSLIRDRRPKPASCSIRLGGPAACSAIDRKRESISCLVWHRKIQRMRHGNRKLESIASRYENKQTSGYRTPTLVAIRCVERIWGVQITLSAEGLSAR